MSANDDPSELETFEVKGLSFTTVRTYIEERYGEAHLQAIARDIPASHRGAFERPLPSQWYPEESLQLAMRATADVIADGNVERFERFLVDATSYGISRFFRVLLRMSGTPFVLRQLPTLQRRIRRPVHVRVEEQNREVMVYYDDFPFFDDPLYVARARAAVRALIRASTQPHSSVTTVDSGYDWLTIRVGLDGPRSLVPPPARPSRPPPSGGG